MPKEMLINVSEGEECRIALVENGRLEELYMERTSATSHVGNIYKGRVTNVEPSIQAAFVDFGLGRNGFLHISDLMPQYFGRAGDKDYKETVGNKLSRRDRPPIQRCLRRGDELLVQIIKEGIGTKGPTLTTYLSIPGKMLVMMPGMGRMGVSKKIEDDEERRRLRQILDGLKPPKDVAFIIRTAGVGKSKTEIERDLKYLTRLWETISKKQKEPAPVELYTEGDLVTRTVRDVFTTDVERIIVDSKDVAKRVKDVIKITAPRTKNKVDVYDEPIPLFHKYGIEKDIELMYSRHVPLASGGSLVIDQTEAIVAIDVNSGKNRDSGDAETTAFRVDMEAADEICRQLKLRDLGGVVICDFIDLRYERHRRELEKRLDDNFRRDRAKTKVLRMSQFGIIEMTRQRMRPSLKRSVYFDCPHCKGAGLVKTPESMALDVMRRLAIAANDLKVARVELHVNPDVAFYLNNKKRRGLADLEEQTQKRILIKADPAIGLDDTRFELFDARDGFVVLDSLGMSMPTIGHTTQLGTRGGGGRPGGGGRFDDRRGRNERHRQPPATTTKAARAYGPEEDEDEDSRAMERSAEDVDQREGEPEPAVRGETDAREPDAEGAAAGTGGGEARDDGRGPRGRGRRRGRGRGRGGNGQADAEAQPPQDDVEPRADEDAGDADEPRDADEQPAAEQPQGRGRDGRGNARGGGNRGNQGGGRGGDRGGQQRGGDRGGQQSSQRGGGGGRGGDRDRGANRSGGGGQGGNVPYYDQGRRSDGSFENVTELETVDFGDDNEDQGAGDATDNADAPQTTNRSRGGGGNQGGGSQQPGTGTGENGGEHRGRRRRRRGRGRGRGGEGNGGQQGPQGDANRPTTDRGEDDEQPVATPAARGRGEGNTAADHDADLDMPEDPHAEPGDDVGNRVDPRTAGDGGTRQGEGLAGGGEGGKRRRRRRGGRRHRRRRDGAAAGEPGDNGPGGNANGDAVPQSAADEDDDAPYDSDAPASATVDDTDDRAVGVEALEEDDDGADVEAQDERSSAAPANELPRRSPPPAPLPVVKTGSSDKHLADDEEVAPQPPARRPRSYSDLDAIPDDYD